jgi:hypothetical protein
MKKDQVKRDKSFDGLSLIGSKEAWTEQRAEKSAKKVKKLGRLKEKHLWLNTIQMNFKSKRNRNINLNFVIERRSKRDEEAKYL